LLKLKQAELMVKSPIDGTVVTWQLKERLNSRPLQVGQVLMRIADLNKEWQLELHMPEQRMGFVEEEQKKLYATERNELRRMLLEQRADAPSAPEKAAVASSDASKAVENGPAAPVESADPPANETANASQAAEPAEDHLATEIDAELAKIPDEQLHDRWSQLVKAKLDVQLKEILKDMPEGDAKNQLNQVLLQPTYEQAWESLSALIGTLPDEDLKVRLAAIPQARFVDENVTFILRTDAGTTLRGRIKEISRSAEVRGDEGNTVLIKVAIDKSQIHDLRPGAEVTAKVHCGRRSLGYVWFHEVVSFIQSKIIFRYF
jgi:pyruvate/2-oxoglutarate dehydrogenase complex dihydrolipoamide acyltransferase (E2) component